MMSATLPSVGAVIQALDFIRLFFNVCIVLKIHTSGSQPFLPMNPLSSTFLSIDPFKAIRQNRSLKFSRDGGGLHMLIASESLAYTQLYAS